MDIKETLKKRPVMGALLFLLGTLTGAELPAETIPLLSDLLIGWLA